MATIKLSIVLLMAVLTGFVTSEVTGPVINTKQGAIIGTTIDFKAKELDINTNIHAFLGIPYAEPPVGSLRFKPPVPAKAWSGELRATMHGNRCPQPAENVFHWNIDGIKDREDCLFLDVFVPTPKPINAAVMIWIHGGAYNVGAAIDKTHYPTPLVAIGDVIVVAINYRLGAFGFLSTADTEAPGNVGMLDQIEAMKWVQDNIADFGGDPDRVTIFGHSAGGASVALHTMSPLSHGLFSSAIMQSGFATAPWAFQQNIESYRKRAYQFGAMVGCDDQQSNSKDLIACLQDVSVIDIINATPQFGDSVEGLDELIYFSPTIDGYFLPDNPHTLIEKGLIHKDISVIVGETADEGMMLPVMTFIDSETEPHINLETLDILLAGILQSNELLIAATKLFYVDMPRGNHDEQDDVVVNYLHNYASVLTDYYFVCPGNEAAESYAATVTGHDRQVYRYRLNHMPSMTFFNTTWERVCHFEDLLFVFGAHFYQGNDFVWTEEEIDMAVKVMRYWSNFAKTGNPNLISREDNSESHDHWPRFTVNEPAFKDLSLSMRNGFALKSKECQFWNDLVPQLNALKDELESCRQSRSHFPDEPRSCLAHDKSCDSGEATP